MGPQRSVPDPHRDRQRVALTPRRAGATRRRFGWHGIALWVALALTAGVVGGVLLFRYVSGGWLAGDLRGAVVRELGASLGREVSLGGMSGDLIHGVVLHDLRIAEQGGFSRGVAFSVAEVRLTFNWARLLSLHPDVLGSLAQAGLVRPHLVVSRDAAGRWSIADLLRPRGAAGPGAFHGRIVVDEGGLEFHDAYNLPGPPFAATFTHLAGRAEFQRGNEATMALHGSSTSGERVTLTGQYRPSGASVFEFDITTANADAAHWGPYLVRIRQLDWARGRFGGRVHLTFTSSSAGLQLDYAADLTLHDADVQYRPGHLWLRHVTGPLIVDSQQADTSGLAFVAGTSPVVLDGAIVFNGGPWLQLELRSPGLDLATVQALFFPRAALTLTGAAAGAVRVTGPVAALDLEGEITGGHGRLNGQEFNALHTRLRYGAGILSLTNLAADAAGGRLTGDLVLNAATAVPSYLFNGTTRNVDVRALASAGLTALDALSGRVSGRMVGVGTGSRVQLMGDVTMGQGSIRGVAFDGLQAIFWHDAAGAVDLDYVSGQVGGATIYSSGRLGADGTLDLDVLAQDVSLADIGERAGIRNVPFDGHASLQGRATGTEDAPVFSGTVTAWDGRLGPGAFAHAYGDVTVSASGITTHHLAVQNGSAEYRVSGGVTFHPLAAANLHLDAENVQAQWLTNALSFAPDITGSLSAALVVDGPLSHPSLAGQVVLDHGSVNRQRIDHAEVRMTPDGGRIHIADAEARVNGSRLHASGTVDPGGPLDLQVRIDHLHVADIGATLGFNIPAQGTLMLTGEVRGTLSDPLVTGEVSAPDFMIGEQMFDASGAVAYQQGTLRFNSLQLAQGAAIYRMSGDLRLGAQPSAALRLDIDRGRLATVLSATGIVFPAPLDGMIGGRIEFSGPVEDPAAHVALTLRDATFGAYTIGTGVADLTLTHQAIDIDRFEIHPAEGEVAAKGRIDLRGPSSVEVSAQAISPDFLRPFFQFDRPFEGKVNFTVQFSGPLQNPTAGLSLEAADVGVSGALADRIAGLAYYQGGTLHIEQMVISKGPHKVVAAGALPVDPKTFLIDDRMPMHLQLHLQDADLSFLQLLTPRITDAAGTVAGQVDIGGTVAAPQMSGFLRSSGGRLRYAAFSTPFENVNADLVFSQSEIQVRDLSATLGHGQVAVGGTVGVTNFRLGGVELALKASHATVDAPNLYTGTVDADLAVTGTALQPTLYGRAILSDGVLSPGGAGGGGPSAAGPGLGLDVTLESGQNVVFTLGSIRAQVVGSIHAGGTLDHPLLSGRVTSPEGEVAFLGSTFRLTGGEAVFSEALGVEPQISARAQQVYGDTIVFLDVSGLASHPDLTVTSDPPLTEADIINLIARNAGIFGGPESILGQGLGQYLFGSLREALKLSEFTITYSHESPVTLRVGKFLLRNLYLTLSEVFSGPAVATTVPVPGALARPVPPGVSYAVAGLEYFLSPNVLATVNVDTLGGTGVFLLTRFQF